MPGQLRIEYPGTTYHLLSQGATVGPGKLALAARSRRETTRTMQQTADRLHEVEPKERWPQAAHLEEIK